MCHKSDEPIYITKNGYGDMVIMSIERYERAMRQLSMYQSPSAPLANAQDNNPRQNVFPYVTPPCSPEI